MNPGVIITELQKRGGLDEEKYRNFLEHSKVQEVNRLEKYDHCADKIEKKIFLIYKEIQNGSGAKSYTVNGFLIFEEMRKYLVILRRPLVLYDFAPDHF